MSGSQSVHPVCVSVDGAPGEATDLPTLMYTQNHFCTTSLRKAVLQRQLRENLQKKTDRNHQRSEENKHPRHRAPEEF